MKRIIIGLGILLSLQGCCAAQFAGTCCASAVGAAVVTGCAIADKIL